MARKDDPGGVPEELDTGQADSPAVEPAGTTGGEEAAVHPLEDLATERKLKTWELAGLSRLAGWAPGKHATPAEFEAALARFRSRRMGGGR